MSVTTDIQNRKKKILNYIREIKDEQTLSAIEDLIEESIHSLPPLRKPFSREEIIKGVEQSEKDMEEGRFYTIEEAKAKLGL